MVDDKFRVDNMFYQMCVNPLGVFSHDGMDSRDNFDASTAFFTEFRPDGTMNRYNIESFGDDKKIVGSDLTMEPSMRASLVSSFPVLSPKPAIGSWPGSRCPEMKKMR